MPRFLPWCAIVAMTVPAINAATIIWSAPTNETGNASDVVTTGTFLESAWAGGNGTGTLDGPGDIALNGVVFAAQSSNGVFDDGSQITVSGAVLADSAGGSAPGSWNAAYQQLAGVANLSGINGPSATMTITLGGLTIGQNYEVQIFEPWYNAAQFSTTFTAGNTSSAASNGIQGPPITTAQYITGTFTADATTEAIVAAGSGNPHAILAAIQVRTEPVTTSSAPEPEAFGLVAAGLAGVALLRRQRVRRAR